MDWSTAASLATAAGTLVLAVATFVSVRSANRAARVAERTLLAGIRPLLVPSRSEDPEQKVGFADNRWVRVPGGQGAVDVSDEAIYLVISLRNVGSGLGGPAPGTSTGPTPASSPAGGGGAAFQERAFRGVGRQACGRVVGGGRLGVTPEAHEQVGPGRVVEVVLGQGEGVDLGQRRCRPLDLGQGHRAVQGHHRGR